MLPPPIPAPDVLKGIDDQIRAGFDAFRDGWFNWLLISTGVVVLGLLLEIPEIWHDTVRAVREVFWSCKPEGHLPAWTTLVVSLGWFLIVGGVTGELVGESFVSKADGLVQRFDEILLSEAQSQAATSIERAGVANKRAGHVEKEAAGLRKEAAGVTASNLRLEEAIAPRRLTPKQERELESLTQFSGRTVDIRSYANDAEGFFLGSQLVDALSKAHIGIA